MRFGAVKQAGNSCFRTWRVICLRVSRVHSQPPTHRLRHLETSPRLKRCMMKPHVEKLSLLPHPNIYPPSHLSSRIWSPDLIAWLNRTCWILSLWCFVVEVYQLQVVSQKCLQRRVRCSETKPTSTRGNKNWSLIVPGRAIGAPRLCFCFLKDLNERDTLRWNGMS